MDPKEVLNESEIYSNLDKFLDTFSNHISHIEADIGPCVLHFVSQSCKKKKY